MSAKQMRRRWDKVADEKCRDVSQARGEKGSAQQRRGAMRFLGQDRVSISRVWAPTAWQRFLHPETQIRKWISL